MNSTPSYCSAEGPRKQPGFGTAEMCLAVWRRWFERSDGRTELQRILEALDNTSTSQSTVENIEDKTLTEECRTTSPNTCHVESTSIRLGDGDMMGRLDLSVIYRIRPRVGSLFNRQEVLNCQQILLVYPVRTIADSDTESEGRSRPATPTPDDREISDPTLDEAMVVMDTETGPTTSVEVTGTTSAVSSGNPQDQVMEQDATSEPPVAEDVMSILSTRQSGSPEEETMELISCPGKGQFRIPRLGVT